jgi:S1-C subfamily serine protease
MNSKRKTITASALAVSLLGGGFLIGRGTHEWPGPAHANETLSHATSRSGANLPSFADLATRVSPAVVNIRATTKARSDLPDQLFGENFPFRGFGMPAPQVDISDRLCLIRNSLARAGAQVAVFNDTRSAVSWLRNTL